MSTRELGRNAAGRWSRTRAYLRRFFTCWVSEDPEPSYSHLDLRDGLGECECHGEVARLESRSRQDERPGPLAEPATHQPGHRVPIKVGGRAGL